MPTLHTILVLRPPDSHPPHPVYRGMDRQRYLSAPTTSPDLVKPALALDGASGFAAAKALTDIAARLGNSGDNRWEPISVVNPPEQTVPAARFLGWDVGEGAPRFWSAIFHRGEFLTPEENENWTGGLNQHGLFDHVDDASRFLETYLEHDDPDRDYGPESPEEIALLYQPRAIWLRTLPPQSTFAPPPLLGEILWDRFLVTECVVGVPERGRFRGVDLHHGSSVMVTTSLPHAEPPATLEAAVQLRHPHITRLLKLERWTMGAPVRAHLDVMVEEEPPTASADRWPPMTQTQALTAAAALARLVAAVHAAGDTIGGIRPETIYGEPHTSSDPTLWLMPRTERFWAKAPLPSSGIVPPFPLLYQGPETLSGQDPTAASDVFATGLVTAVWLTQNHPFAAPNPMQHLVRLATAPPMLHGISNPIVELLTHVLAKSPASRPLAADLAVELEKLASNPS
ncbi:MAG: hypothetical protein HUU55_17825 [Myxococcales bacterium]|nr:hypothetical protein [Myxococcales bacterium]